MEQDITLGDIYEEIAERLALARTKALMGEREEAMGIFQGASLEYRRFQDVLSGYPGHLALEHAFQATMAALCEERTREHPATRPEKEPKPTQTARSRKRVRQAA